MSIDERLEHELKLSDLINAESLRNLSSHFTKLLRVGIVVTDPNHSVLIASAERLRLCDSAAGAADACPACAFELPRFPGDAGKFTSVSCPSGVEYQRARVDNQFDPAGFLIMGPYAMRDGVAAGQLKALPAFSQQHAKDMLELLCVVFEELVFVNYQSYLITKTHLQLVAEESSADQSQSTDSETDGDDEALLESGELHSLF